MEEKLENSPKVVSPANHRWAFLVAILIGAWIVGMSIIIAGWMISKEVAKNNSQNSTVTTSTQNGRIDIEIPNSAPVLGNKDAKAVIVEFADFQCPYCQEWNATVFPELKSKYIDTGKAKFVFMNFSFLGEESDKAAKASLCAFDQGKFWEYHDLLYEKQAGENSGIFVDANLKQFAKDLNLNTADFNSCYDTDKHKSDLAEQVSKAMQYGVQSTPTVFINGIKYQGIYSASDYGVVIDSELSK